MTDVHKVLSILLTIVHVRGSSSYVQKVSVDSTDDKNYELDW